MTFQQWHSMTGDEVCRYWQSYPEQGLMRAVANRRLRQFGKNYLKEGKKVSAVAIFISQFNNFMVVVLLIAVLLSGLLKQWDDAATIMVIIALNAFLGFIQEYRAERSLAYLKAFSAPVARCIRDGNLQRLPASELVPGDIIELERGERIPADARLLEAISLDCDESILTGESMPRSKITDPLTGGMISLGDKANMVFAGTMITRGKGKAIVVATGMSSEMGRIAGMLERVESETTPMQRRLTQLGQLLVGICVFICLIVVVLGIWRGEPVFYMVMAGISLAVAAIPEGLPAIVTVSLALGVQRMIKCRVIVRKLPAVETLGCATAICSDKTGTLTKNEMTVKEIYTNGHMITVTGEGYLPRGGFLAPEIKKWPINEEHLQWVLTIAALCNNCSLIEEKVTRSMLKREEMLSERWSIIGDPTEGALLVAAAKAGIWADKINKKFPRVCEIPFEAERQRMVTVHDVGDQVLICVKGAPDVILDLSTEILENGKIENLTARRRQEIKSVIANMTGRALRVLAVAMRYSTTFTNNEDEAGLENNLVFAGLLGLIDPPREEVKEAISRCRKAGIYVIMVTGDHPSTAEAIAKELGLLQPEGQILSGAVLDEMQQWELEKIVDHVPVYARVSPRHKLRIVRALKKKGHIVAMTGDGVNDAPAIKEADIGIAMGITGTDVAKEASAMIIQDDNFATIVAAIEEGRAIYDNIRKFIRYLLSSNIGEVMTMFLAAAIGLPLPVIPIQILWINLVTDGLPALALGVEPPEAGLMERPPRHPDESVFSRGLSNLIVTRGFQIGFFTLIVFILGKKITGNLIQARAMAFTSLVLFQLIHVFECRSETKQWLKISGNPYLVLTVLISVFLQLLVLYCPLFWNAFQTFPLLWKHWLVIFGAVLIFFWGRQMGSRK